MGAFPNDKSTVWRERGNFVRSVLLKFKTTIIFKQKINENLKEFCKFKTKNKKQKTFSHTLGSNLLNEQKCTRKKRSL